MQKRVPQPYRIPRVCDLKGDPRAVLAAFWQTVDHPWLRLEDIATPAFQALHQAAIAATRQLIEERNARQQAVKRGQSLGHAPQPEPSVQSSLPHPTPGDPFIEQMAAELGAVVKRVPRIPRPPSSGRPHWAQPLERLLPVDGNLARVARALMLAAALRVYVVAQQLVRETGGAGHVSIAALNRRLKALDVQGDNGAPYSARHIRRLIAQTEGIFFDRDVRRRRVYVRSAKRVAPALIRLAHERGLDAIYLTDRPGNRPVKLCVSGTLENWHAQIYLGWITQREGVTISRAALETLFQCDQSTLRRWEQTRLSASLRVRHNYARLDPYAENDHTPAGGQRRATEVFQIPNSYIPSNIRQHTHPHKGTARKVRALVNQEIRQLPPVDNLRDGLPRNRRYFEDSQKKRRSQRKGRVEDVSFIWQGESRRCQYGLFVMVENHAITAAHKRRQRLLKGVKFERKAGDLTYL